MSKLLYVKPFPCTVFTVASRGGNAGTSLPPPPEIGKIVVEIWYYLSLVYILSERKQNSKEYFVKIVKKSIFHRDFDQKITKFSGNLSKLSSFVVQMRKNLKGAA